MTKDQQIAQLNAQLNQPHAQAPESLGPFKVIGRLFGLVGVAVNVTATALGTVDKTVYNFDKQLDKGFQMANIASEGMLLDFANDEIVNSAKRRVSTATANAEADAIIASLSK